jgi:hypothetical protein
MMANTNMYVTVKRVNPDRLRCPVKDCQEEGKEENRVDTPFISGLGPMTVYLCDAHATKIALMFLDKHAAVDTIHWDEEVSGLMPSPTQEQGDSPLFQALWQVIKSWDINVPEYYQGYCGASGSHVVLLLNALSAYVNVLHPVPLPVPIEPLDRPGEAGALFAFMGWLTTRKQVSGPFSSHHEAGQAAQLIRQFVDMQCWPDPPENWHHSIKPFDEDEKEALGRAHLDNAKRTKTSWTGEVEAGGIRMPFSSLDMSFEDELPF